MSVEADPARAVAAVSSEHVDVCMMELSFPEGNTGIVGIAAVHGVSPDTRVVVLTGSSDPQLIVLAMEAGADAIVFKDDDIDFIVEIVNRVDRGSLTESPRCATPSSGTTRDTDDLGRFLTYREYEVLQHLVDGHSAKHLARDLDIAYSTARSHIQNILVKLGVHSRLEAVAFAREHDLCQRTVPPAVAVARNQPGAAA